MRQSLQSACEFRTTNRERERERKVVIDVVGTVHVNHKISARSVAYLDSALHRGLPRLDPAPTPLTNVIDVPTTIDSIGVI